MRRRSASRFALAFALLILFPIAAEAQAVLGPQDDALVLPRGVLRVRLLHQVARFNERYGENTPGRPDGSLEPIGIDFNLDTVGTTTFRNLTPLEGGLRQLTGIPDFTLTLGQTVLNADVRVTATPIVVEYGITERFSMGLIVPYVRTRNNVFFDVNPAGNEGNVGFNPALAGAAPALAANAAVQTEFANAAAQLQQNLAFCAANPTVGNCPALNAQAANANTLIATTNAFAAGLASVYGNGTAGTGSPFVPIAGTDAQAAIAARIAAFNALYQQFLGTTNTVLGTTPFASQARLTEADAQTILTNAAFGINGEPLQTVERSGIGDVELGAKLQLWDSMRDRGLDRLTSPPGLHFRTSVGANFRFGTGDPDLPQNFADVGTGNGQNDLELRAFGDVVYGRHLFTSVIARYGIQFADKLEMRIFDAPERALTAGWRQHEVERNLGDYYELEANQRVVMNDWFSVTGHYLYRHKAQDEYTGTFEIPGSMTGYGDVTLQASNLNQQTEFTEHRLGGGLSFSTVAAFQQGRFRLPLEVTYFHFQTTKGSGGNLPKVFLDQVQVRLYARILGGP